MLIDVQFSVSSEVEESARGVVGSGPDSLAVREESASGLKMEKISVEIEGKGNVEPTYCTALMSLSWPMNVCTHLPDLISHNLAVASHAPETKIF